MRFRRLAPLPGVVALLVSGGLALPADAAATPASGSPAHAEAIIALYTNPADPPVGDRGQQPERSGRDHQRL